MSQSSLTQGLESMHFQGWAQAQMSFCFACGSCPSVLVLAAARGVRPSLPSLRRTQCWLAYQPCCQLYLLCRPCCCAPEVTSVTGPLEQTVHLTSSLVNNALGARAKGQGKGQGEGQAEAEAQTSSAVGSAACARASASPCGRSRSRPLPRQVATGGSGGAAPVRWRQVVAGHGAAPVPTWSPSTSGWPKGRHVGLAPAVLAKLVVGALAGFGGPLGGILGAAMWVGSGPLAGLVADLPASWSPGNSPGAPGGHLVLGRLASEVWHLPSRRLPYRARRQLRCEAKHHSPNRARQLMGHQSCCHVFLAHGAWDQEAWFLRLPLTRLRQAQDWAVWCLVASLAYWEASELLQWSFRRRPQRRLR